MLELAVVIPTFNERDNVLELVRRLDVALAGLAWEAVFVDDDSPDGTADVVRQLSLERPNVRCVQRIGRRGLSRAVVEGVLSSAAPVLAVIDADLQHDETRLPLMLQRLQQEGLDLVVGTRYADGGSVGAWDQRRAQMSRLATRMSRMIVKQALSDPMSGFFMIRRSAFMESVRRLSGEGFKILLDLLASSPRPLKFAEVPYTFRQRHAGQSKLDSAVLWEFLLLIVDKSVGRYVPARFVLFSLVGASGVVIHFSALWALHRGAGLDFLPAQLAATGLAMTSNYLLNNTITYRDKRRQGIDFFKGLLSFYAICGIGVIGNVGVASVFFARNQSWLLAGGVGALVGTVWNYAASSIFTWGRRKA
jgi:dolichol-phosphate mannosyltransferase